MAVEAFVIAACVEDGVSGLKKCFQAGIHREDFPTYEEEWDWLCEQLERGRAINWRRFQTTFPEFERIVPNERIQELCKDLKNETGYMSLVAGMEQTLTELTPDNIIEKAEFIREISGEVLRLYQPHSDVVLSGNSSEYLRRMKDLQVLRENLEVVGIPTGIASLDVHYGGLQNGRAWLVLGRPGDAKSMLIEKLYIHAFLDGRIAAMFSPEMNEDEHRARITTLLTAVPSVQEELGLTKAIKNKALLDGTGYNYKTLKRVWEWVEKQPGMMVLHTNRQRRQKMSPAFIESRIDDLGIEAMFVDPIYKLKSTNRTRGQAKWEALLEITDEIVDMCKMFSIPVVMSNQANRNVGNRGDAPHKDNSFGGDSPVQEADHVIGVKHNQDDRSLQLRCTKNRFGANFRVDLKFMPNIGIMEDVSKIDPTFYSGNEDGSSEKDDAAKELEKDD